MIVVDSSALIAIFEVEDDASFFAEKLAGAEKTFMSALNVHETCIVMYARHGDAGLEKTWQFLKNILEVEICPFDESQAKIASLAYSKFGKGTGSRAGLNLADCASYALAKSLDLPLLYKGNDFIHTDIKSEGAPR